MARNSTVTPVFRGGLGNNLFQIAATERLAQRIGASASYRPQRADDEPEYQPFGGHPLGAPPGLPQSLAELFPQLAFTADPADHLRVRASADVMVQEHPDFRFRRTPMPRSGQHVVLDGYFFDTPIRGAFRHELRRKLEPATAVRQHIEFQYGALFAAPTVALHLRLGNPVDCHPVPPNSLHWYQQVLRRLPESTRILVCSDDPPAARRFLADLALRREFVFIEGEPVYVDLFLMARCDHQIVHNSTLSAWASHLALGHGRSYAHLQHYAQVHGLRATPLCWRDPDRWQHLKAAVREVLALRRLSRERLRAQRQQEKAWLNRPPFHVRLRRRTKALLKTRLW